MKKLTRDEMVVEAILYLQRYKGEKPDKKMAIFFTERMAEATKDCTLEVYAAIGGRKLG